MEHKIESLQELADEASAFVGQLVPQEGKATLVTLSGELGAGKTAFTKEVAKALGVEETVTSPTFVLEKIYQLPEGKPFARLIHIDAYRLESGTELSPLGYDAFMQDPQNLVLLEWPEKVADALGTPTLEIRFSVSGETTRTLSYNHGA